MQSPRRLPIWLSGLVVLLGMGLSASAAHAEGGTVARRGAVVRSAESVRGWRTGRRLLEVTRRTLGTVAEMVRVGARASWHLRRPLGPGKLRAIWQAHRVGLGERGADGKPAGIGSYTMSQLFRKGEILRAASLSAKDRRTLIENGVVGRRSEEREKLADELYEDDDRSYHRRRKAREEREEHYSSKGGHKKRSIANAPIHEEHWKKEEKRNRWGR